MINFILLISRQGKTRLTKWFTQMNAKVLCPTFNIYLMEYRIKQELFVNSQAQFCHDLPSFVILSSGETKKSYTSACVDKDDNELIVLEQIHLFVEVLDRYFGNVCELDIIFNFHKAYYIMDELFIGGNIQETSKVEVLRICAAMDEMMDETKEEGTTPGRPNARQSHGGR